MSVNNPTCPQDCTSTLPAASFDVCAPETHFGQIKKLYIANDGYPLTDWTDASEWATRIDNASTSSNAIRELTIIGSLARAESSEKKISGGRTVKGKKTRTLSIKVDETNDINYEFLRTLECGLSYRVWYATDDHLYGGNDGILMTLNIDEVIPENEEDYVLFEGEGKWFSQFAPERTANIIA